jgi:aspartokinase
VVGRGIRKVLSRVSQSMKIFESEELWLASYSANDLAFTLVVPEKSGTELVNRLHAELIETNAQTSDEHFGPDWAHLQNVNDNA